MNVKIGFSGSKSIISKIIRWFSKSVFSHSYIRFGPAIANRDIVASADAGGILIHDAEAYNTSQEWLLEVQVPSNIDVDAGVCAIEPLLGTTYDYGSLFGRAWVYLCGWFGRKVRNPLSNPNRDVCCELVIRFLNGAGINVPGDQEISTPETVLDYLQSIGWQVVYRKGI